EHFYLAFPKLCGNPEIPLLKLMWHFIQNFQTNLEQIRIGKAYFNFVFIPIGKFFGNKTLAAYSSFGGEYQNNIDQKKKGKNIEQQLYCSKNIRHHIGDKKT